MELDKRKTDSRSWLSRVYHSSLTSVILFCVLWVVVMSILTPNFLSAQNVYVIFDNMTVTAVVGLAQMVIIATGGMNLAVGSIGGLVAVLAGGSMAVLGFGAFTATLVGLLVGMGCGAINGILISKLGANGAAAFLVTLATQSAFRGVNYGLTKAQPFYDIAEGYKEFGSGMFLGIPYVFFMMIVIAVIVALIFKYTGIGRRILAFGSNAKASELYGVSTTSTLVAAHTMSGVIAGCAGLLLMARLNSSQNDIGNTWMMFSFAAPIIGGCRMAGGKVTIVGAVLGALVLALIQDGLIFLKLDVYLMRLIEGCIILLAVTIERLKVLSEQKARLAA